MSNLLDNCSYNNAKIVHELSSLAWFIDHHALKDAREIGDADCAERLQSLSDQLKQYITIFYNVRQSYK